VAGSIGVIGIAILSVALASGAAARTEGGGPALVTEASPEPAASAPSAVSAPAPPASAPPSGAAAPTSRPPVAAHSSPARPSTPPRASAEGTAGIETLLSQGTQAVRRGALSEAIGRLEAALDLARNQAPLQARRFLLVQEDAPGFGQYVPRPTNVFSPGEEMLFYLEPVNYTFRRKAGLFEASLKVDVNLLEPDGTVIYGKRDFFAQIFSAQSKIHDLYLNLSLEVSGLEDGVYRVEYVVKDAFSGKACTVRQDVVIREPEPVLHP